MNWHLSVLALFLGSLDAIEIRVKSDPQDVKEGKEVVMECEVRRLDEGLRDCIWVGPDGRTKYYDGLNENGNVEVETDTRDEICRIIINSVRGSHSGPWECIAEDDNRDDEDTKFVFLTITPRADKLKILLEPDQRVFEASIGKSVEIICPSNTRFGRNSRVKPSCTFTSPTGKTYQTIGRRGELFTHERGSISFAGDLDAGDCGISIGEVKPAHLGKWTCLIVKPRESSQSKTEVAKMDIILADERVAARFERKMIETEPNIQGYSEGDPRVKLFANVTIDDQDEDNSIYWIVQRKYIVKEGKEFCPTDRRGNDCYFAREREKVEGTSNVYEVGLEIDELSLDDIEEPIVLVKDNEDRNGKRKTTHQIIPRRLDEGIADIIDSGCIIKNKAVNVGEYVPYRDLCVEVKCVDDGEVDVFELRNCN